MEKLMMARLICLAGSGVGLYRRLAVCCLLCLGAWQCCAAVYFSVKDLGKLEDSWSTGGAFAVNSLGDVAVTFTNASGFQHAYLYSGGITTDLGTLGGRYSAASGINDTGQVVGWAYTAGGQQMAFRTAPRAPISATTDSLGTLGSDRSFANGVNNLGQVVGYSKTADTHDRAFRTAQQGAITPASNLGVLTNGIDSYAYGINDLGQVVGASVAGDGSYRAFRTGPNLSINPLADDLGTLGGLSSSAAAINSMGQVVGTSMLPSGLQHAFRTSPNAGINLSTDDLGTLGGDTSAATSVNSLGQVVGWSHDSLGQDQAFVYTDSLGMLKVQDLVDAASGWTFVRAYAINDACQIVGVGALGGVGHAFLLTPPYGTPTIRADGELAAGGQIVKRGQTTITLGTAA